MQRIQIVCRSCGSTNVTRDALASWDEEAQRWELIDTLDNADCNDCGGECSLDEVPISAAVSAPAWPDKAQATLTLDARTLLNIALAKLREQIRG